VPKETPTIAGDEMAMSKELTAAVDRWGELHSARLVVRGKELLLEAALRKLTAEDRATFDEALSTVTD
jgi:hypothetical protein